MSKKIKKEIEAPVAESPEPPPAPTMRSLPEPPKAPTIRKIGIIKGAVKNLPTEIVTSAVAALLFVLSVFGVSAQNTTPPTIRTVSGSVYTERLLWNLAASTTTNRIYYTNAGSYFGNTNTSELNIRTNGSGRWEWRSGATVLATNTLNRQYGTWKTNGTGAAVYGYTRYEPTATSEVRTDVLGVLVNPTNFAAANGLGGGNSTNAVNATNLYGNSLVRGAYFVDAGNGSDTTGDGSSGKPWASIGKANTNAVVGSTIYVLPGTYGQPIARGGVVWELAYGVIITGSVGIQVPTQTNIIVRGKGTFTATIPFSVTDFSAPLLDLEAYAILSSLLIDFNNGSGGDAKVRVSNAFIDGLTVADGVAGSDGGDFEFNNCSFWTNASGADITVLMRGCATKINQPALVHVGTLSTHTNMLYRVSP